jgi:hypothetical protein
MAGTARDFAQIGCCGAKSGVPRKLFSASAGALPNRIDGSRRRNRCDARVRANDDALRNAQLFSRFFSRTHSWSACVPRHRRRHLACLAGGSAAFAAGTPRHIRVAKVLTVEKTVIRFRPADDSCGSE